MTDAGAAYRDPDAHGGPSFDELTAASEGPGAGASVSPPRHEAPAGPRQQTDAGGREPVDPTGATEGPAGTVLDVIRSRPAVVVATVIALVAAVVIVIRRLRD